MKTKTRKKPIDVIIRSWLLMHAQSFIYSLGQYYRNLLSSVLTTAVIGISLAFPAGFYLLLENAQTIASGWDGAVQITAFLKQDIDDDAAQLTQNRLQEHPDIARTRIINKEQAFNEYKELSGFAEVITMLDANPFPSIIVIHPETSALENDGGETIMAFIQNQDEVDVAQYDQQWVKRLYGIIETIQRFVLIFSVFISFGVLLIVGNTIRMAIYHHKSEIEITKLFGATNHFIQRPFLYTGFWYGISGGIMAWLLLCITLLFLNQPISQLAELYSSEFAVSGLSGLETLALLCCGIFLGLFGSWISVQRHLRAIEPE